MSRNRLGIMLDEEKTDQINVISHSFKKTPEKFINDIIQSTYDKIQMLTLRWDDDEQ